MPKIKTEKEASLSKGKYKHAFAMVILKKTDVIVKIRLTANCRKYKGLCS